MNMSLENAVNGCQAMNEVALVDKNSLKKLHEGKTKVVYELPNEKVLLQSKDKITAFNAERSHSMGGKAKISTVTTSLVFEYLKKAGISTHYLGKSSDTEFVAMRCEMIPIEWIARRVATGSFLKRNEGVPEGFRFNPVKVEISFKDDELGDPFWTEEMLISKQFTVGGRLIGTNEVKSMKVMTKCVFEVLERAWWSQNCSLIDMKIEFGVVPTTGEIVLADVVDSDSWRLWPSGDKRLQLDKQFYRDLPEVDAEHLKKLKENYETAAAMFQKFLSSPACRVVVLMGSASDKPHCEKIRDACATFGLPCVLRISSAHKSTAETLQIVADYEGDGIPTVFICVAGRSNGLGPVVSGNTSYPVINCPPIGSCMEDVWSSLRLPTKMGCSTILEPGNAAQAAASFFALNNHQIWAKLRVMQMNTMLKIWEEDARAS